MEQSILELIKHQKPRRVKRAYTKSSNLKTTEEKVYDCPLCDDTGGHLNVNEKKNLWHCFKCGSGGKVDPLRGILKNVPFTTVPNHNSDININTVRIPISQIIEEANFSRIINRRNKDQLLRLESKSNIYGKADIWGVDCMIFEYFADRRGWSINEMIRYKLSHSIVAPYDDRGVIFWRPTKDADPKYFVARAIPPLTDHPRYLNPPNTKDFLWTTFYLDKIPKKMVLVEGAMDAVPTARVCPAGAILGSQLSDGQINFIYDLKKGGLKEVVVLLDKATARKKILRQDGTTRTLKNETDKTMCIYNQLKDFIKVTPVFMEYAKDPGSASPDYLEDLINP